MEFINFSECFYRSKESQRKFLNYLLLNPRKIHPITKSEEEKGVKGFAKHILLWIALTFSWLIWGHGERPSRTLYAGILIVILSAYLHTFGYLSRTGTAFVPNFFQAFYFSIVTFTTVGYGDITPALSFNKIIAVFDALCGMFVMSLFVVGLSRKYMRI
jgi:hypothetical protein